MAKVCIRKFGQNPDVDSGSTPEVIWNAGGGAYPFPAAALPTTIVSTDANDTAAGTGARTVLVEGLNSKRQYISEIATLAGLTPVALANDYLRVWRAKVKEVGSGLFNAGNISIQHSPTNLAQIGAGLGRTQLAVFTFPIAHASEKNREVYACYIESMWASLSKQASGSVEITMYIREWDQDAGLLYGRELISRLGIHSNAAVAEHDFALHSDGHSVPPGSDVWLEVTNATANNNNVLGEFDISYKY